MVQFYRRLLRWQQEVMAMASPDLATIVHAYCGFLRRCGIEVTRANLGLTTLHPQIEVLRYVWYDERVDPGAFPSDLLFCRKVRELDGCTIDETHLVRGAKRSPQFLGSPFYRLVNGERSLSYRLEPGRAYEFGILDELAAAGATHYYATNVPGAEGHISLATRRAGGFDAAAIDHIERSLSALGLLLENALEQLILDTVLDCYVGCAPRDEIKRGNIRPGAMIDVEGAIWFSDIRKYSTLTQTTEQRVLMERLNAYYESVVPIIYAHRGEVLKFIGDAILAIFPVDGAGATRACRDALAAATAANEALERDGSDFRHGVGLHYGQFQFGNIGALRRMDFTVIGNEVNVASRIEGQCSVQQKALLMSEVFVTSCDVRAELVAQAQLKGLAGDFPLYSIADGVAAAAVASETAGSVA